VVTGAARRSLLPALATRHIIDRGFEGFSVNELAVDLGISVGGLYRYIKAKSDLLVMACESIYGGLREQIAEITTGDAPLPDKLRASIELYLRECEKNRDQILLMYREYRHLPAEAHQRYKDRERGVACVFADLIGSGVRRGIFREVEPTVLAEDIVLLGHLPALKGWALRGEVDPAVLIEEQVKLIMARVTTGEEVDDDIRRQVLGPGAGDQAARRT
jgi:AcrR family transcriptional regulator